MRRLTILVAGLLLPLAQAVAGTWTVGGNLGYALGDANATSLNQKISSMGLNASATNNAQNRKNWQAYVGYQYTPKWGLEIGYVDLGRVETTFTGTIADFDTFITTVQNIHPQTAQGWQASASYRYSVDKDSNAVLKVGVLDWTNRYTLASTSVTRTFNNNGISGVIGLGFETKLIDKWLFNVNLSRYNIDGEPVSIVDLGLLYRFE